MRKLVRLFVVPVLVAAAPFVFAAGQSGPQTPQPVPPIIQPNPLPPILGPVDPTPTQPPPTGS